MTATSHYKILPYLLSLLLVMATIPQGALAMYQNQQGSPPPESSSGYSGQGAAESAQELQSLVAPIALYPDALVAQILSAATFPDQIAVANYWLAAEQEPHRQRAGPGGERAIVGPQRQGPHPVPFRAEQHGPEPGVDVATGRGLPQPAVRRDDRRPDLARPGQGCRQSQVRFADHRGATVAADHRHSTDQSPDCVCPAIQPDGDLRNALRRSRYTALRADVVATGLLSFGAGMAVGAMMSGGCCGWGYSSWNCNWYHGGGVYYGAHPYYGNTAWHGGYYGNGYNDYGNHPYNNGYNSSGYHPNITTTRATTAAVTTPTTYNHNTNVSGNTVNVNRGDTSASNSWNKSGWGSSDAARGWGSQDTGSKCHRLQRIRRPLRFVQLRWRRLGRSLRQLSRLGQPRRRRRLGWRRWLPVEAEAAVSVGRSAGTSKQSQQGLPRRAATTMTRNNARRIRMSLNKLHVSRCWVLLALLALVISIASCSKQEKPAETPTPAAPEDLRVPRRCSQGTGGGHQVRRP